MKTEATTNIDDLLEKLDACSEAREWARGKTWEEMKDRSSDWRQNLLAKIEYSESGCWNWLSGVNPNGYAMFNIEKRPIKATRAMWIFLYGESPTLHILHKCDNRKCVNPWHLFLGTHQENMNDKVAKGRQARTGNKTNLTRTHCPQGHEYSIENTKWYRGTRYCIICGKEHKRRNKIKARIKYLPIEIWSI